jgi:alanyl-tRNA synthetase
VDGVKLVTKRVAGLDKGGLRTVSDSLRDRLGSGVVVVVSENDGKVSLVVSVTKDLTSRMKAGQLVKELAPIVGGGGGGRPDFAEAGGKDPSKIDALLRPTFCGDSCDPCGAGASPAPTGARKGRPYEPAAAS